MKKLIFTILTLLIPAVMTAQNVYTKQFDNKTLVKKAQRWAAKGKWRNGFTAAAPDSSVNLTEFYLQYKKNPKQWKTLFRWIAETDLLNIPKGKHKIESSDLMASVEDSQNGLLNKRRSESHYKHIDFQYVVKGTERFGIIEHNTSRPNCEYRPDVIHYDYDVTKARFFDSAPDRFFIFFPSDWHVAKIANDTQDQNIRVIVIKVDYVE